MACGLVGVEAGTRCPHQPTLTLAWPLVGPLVFLHTPDCRLLTVTTNPVSSLPFYHLLVILTHIYLCECAVAISCLCVHPSVCHTRDPHPNCWTYWNTLCTVRYSDVRCMLS